MGDCLRDRDIPFREEWNKRSKSPISLCAAQSVSADPQRWIEAELFEAELFEAELFEAELFEAELFEAEPSRAPNHIFVNAARDRISRLTPPRIGS